MYPSSTPLKPQKTVTFSDVFRGWRKYGLGTNGLRRANKGFFKGTNLKL